MEVMRERVVGLDVQKAMIVACVRIMSAERSIASVGPSRHRQPAIEALLGWLTASGCTHVAMEATGVYWKPVWNILSDPKSGSWGTALSGRIGGICRYGDTKTGHR